MFVDTDAPSADQARIDETVSQSAVLDTVRVDILDEADTVQVFRELSATSNIDWPLSFGLAPPESGAASKVRIRVRGFRAREATSDIEKGITTLTADPALSIDRTFEIPMPADGIVDTRTVVLRTACFGRPTSFGEHTSCVDAEHLSAPFGEPEVGRPMASAEGTSPLARDVPCAEPGTTDRICIPGGISVLGSGLVVGLSDTVSSLPLRIVRVSPFYMDRTEVTVGRARKVLAQLSDPPFEKGSKDLEFSDLCTFTKDGSSDDFPLNCVSEDAARQICALAGGTLPTEAQWNHAATGRGQNRRFSWGDSDPKCCSASLARDVPVQRIPAQCAGATGTEPVASHLGSADCPGDVSRDGVVDLAGSLIEMLADQSQPFDDLCWGESFGMLLDPTCSKRTGISAIGSRGSAWEGPLFTSLSTFRRRSVLGTTLGFRCVYPAKAAP